MGLPNLRSIFASSRTSEEERQLSRSTFYKFTAFVASCLVISLLAARSAREVGPRAATRMIGMGKGAAAAAVAAAQAV